MPHRDDRHRFFFRDRSPLSSFCPCVIPKTSKAGDLSSCPSEGLTAAGAGSRGHFYPHPPTAILRRDLFIASVYHSRTGIRFIRFPFDLSLRCTAKSRLPRMPTAEQQLSPLPRNSFPQQAFARKKAGLSTGFSAMFWKIDEKKLLSLASMILQESCYKKRLKLLQKY